MVDRGVCTFVMKVRHAQRIGAAAVLIADNVCQCNAVNCTADDPAELCEPTEPMMADDGSGADISIPAFLVFKQDADVLKETLRHQQPLRVEMSFSIPAPDARVEYDFWTTPKDPLSRTITSFKYGAEALGKNAFFTPHMYIYDGKRSGCQSLDGDNQCYNLCTNSGRYCATDPDSDMDAGVSGADIVTESLRRLCIWKEYGEDGIGKEWWDYVEEFMFRCDSKDAYFTQDKCISDAMTHAGVDKQVVESCMSDSGGLEGDVSNVLLEAELARREVSGVVMIPSLFVNQAPIRGALSFSTVFKAVCAGFAPGSEPDVCNTCAKCHDEEGCVRNGSCGGGFIETGVSGSTFLATLVGLSAAFGVVAYIQHRRQQRYMREQVRGILAEYMPLDENQKHEVDTSVGLSEDGSDAQFTIS